MGKRGPRPDPTELHVLRGSWQGKARQKAGEVSASDGDPVKPTWLCDVASLKWDEVTSRLRGQQMLSCSYGDCIAQFCEAWATYVSLCQECVGAVFVVKGERGGTAPNPLFRMRDQAWERVMKAGREFGYSPSSKVGLNVEKKPQDTSKQRFFKGGA